MSEKPRKKAEDFLESFRRSNMGKKYPCKNHMTVGRQHCRTEFLRRLLLFGLRASGTVIKGLDAEGYVQKSNGSVQRV